MPGLNQHVNVTSSARNFLTNRFSRHPERYLEIFRVFRKYELHHVAAEFGMAHRHEEEEDLAVLNGHEEDDGSFFLLAYWMGRYHRFIGPPEG